MLKGIFSNIYEKNIWCSPESRSGGGSEMLRTQMVRERLPLFLEALGVSLMLDAGCGDWNWMSTISFPGVKVLACDIVDSMIRANRERFGRKATFFSSDLTCDVLPEVDLILCRTVLFHLSFEHGLQMLENFKRSGAQYLLITHHPHQQENHNIQDGMWRRLNLCQAPFNFPEPIELIEDGEGEDGYLGLWDLESL